MPKVVSLRWPDSLRALLRPLPETLTWADETPIPRSGDRLAFPALDAGPIGQAFVVERVEYVIGPPPHTLRDPFRSMSDPATWEARLYLHVAAWKADGAA